MSAAAPSSSPFSPRAVFLMLLVGVTAFVGLGVLGAYAPAIRARTQGGDNALSRSAVGYAGVLQLLRDEGVPVTVSRARVPPQVGAQGLMVFTPDADTTTEALRAALPAARRVLIVLPKWRVLPNPAHPGWTLQGVAVLPIPQPLVSVLAAGAAAHKPGRVSFSGSVTQRKGTARLRLANVGPLFQSNDQLWTGPIDALQTLSVPTGEVQLADDKGRTVLLKLNPDLFVLSEPDLLNNRGVASLEAARTATTLLEELRGGQGPVVWDVTLNGLGRARSMLGLALTPPFLGASLCGLAAALLMGAHAAARFGPARPAERAYPLGKTALLDNTALLIRQARREPRMGRRYAALVRRLLGARVLALGAGEPAGEAAAARIDPALDRLTPPGDQPFSELAREAEAARDLATLMRAARRLDQRRREMLGGRS